MAWLGRLFDARDTFLRLLLLDLSGISYLIINADHPLNTTQLVLAVAEFVAAPACYRRPVLMLVTQTALLGLAILLIDDLTINQVGASWALLELTMWASRTRTIWLGAGLLAAVRLTYSIGDPPHRFIAGVWGVCIVVGIPLLLGLVIRTSRELARQAEERSAEQPRRLESEAREARADDRSAIARELHDVVAHHVASMVLRVGVARHVLSGLPREVTGVFDDVHASGTPALADLRRWVAVRRTSEAMGADAALTAIEPAALPAALDA